MGSVIFTDEEARYIKAMLGWQDPILLDNERRRSKLNGEADARTKQPVGEFRILVAGAKGVGKTSILTRVRGPSLMIRLRSRVAEAPILPIFLRLLFLFFAPPPF